MSAPADVAIRIATREDIPIVVDVLATTLHDSEIARWLVPDPVDRHRVYRDYFQLVTPWFVEHKHATVYLTDDRNGAAVWVSCPGRFELNIANYHMRLSDVCGHSMWRWIALDEAMNAHHPGTPHEYLAHLGVDLGERGHGIGTALLAYHHRVLDATASPTYVVATGERPVALYQRAGYISHDPHAIGERSIRMGAMRAATHPIGAQAATEARAARLREAMVDRLLAAGLVRTPSVIGALRTVARHRYLPDLPLTHVYADPPPDGPGEEPASRTLARPGLIASLLEQAQVQDGHHVLQVGADSYTAALLAHLAGERGQVTVVDANEHAVEVARMTLAAAGHPEVRVVRCEGGAGFAPCAPYDRVIATMSVGEVPSRWCEQVALGGRLVVPLRIRGAVLRTVAFAWRAGVWASLTSRACNHPPTAGYGDDGHTVTDLNGDGAVQLHTYPDQHVDVSALPGVLNPPAATVYTGVSVGLAEPIDQLELWLTCALDHGLGRMLTARAAVAARRVQPAGPWGAMATTDGAALAYLTRRPIRTVGTGTGHRYELGVIGHGPGAARLADRMAAEISTWDRKHRTTPARLALQTDLGADPIAGTFVMATSGSRLAVTWDHLHGHDNETGQRPPS